MAYFCEIAMDQGREGLVLRVHKIADEDCLDGEGNESESVGAAFCNSIWGGTWKQCSYNKRIRTHFPSPGFTYDEGRDAFIPPQPYSSWTLNNSSLTWEAPVALPADASMSNPYTWDEESKSWTQ